MKNEKLNFEVTEKVTKIEKPLPTTIETKIYMRCWLQLGLFFACLSNGETDAGRLRLLMTISGNFGSIVFGMILDKSKKFKAVNVFIYVFTLFGQILLAIGLIMEIKWLVFVSIGVIWITTISYTSIGLELSAEATYPEPEEIPSEIT